MQGKIFNPKTKRWVKRDGKIGKELIALTSKDKLYFYSKSALVPAGKGTNEIANEYELYDSLGTTFRQVLSNFHVCPFKYQGYTYNSIEHVFQAMKIALADKEEAFKFTVESGHDIGLGDGAMAQKNRKLVKLDDSVLNLWHTIKHGVMRDAALEKYKTCQESAKILKATLGAELWHVVSRKKPERFHHLEEIRKLL
jgi:predicted NAD-dependent protein-ADP-ribosyltransferase YbiA (DUF1768 family)